MRDTRVDREILLAHLRANREKHEAAFLEARATWTQEATDALTMAATRAVEEGIINVNPLKDLPKPESYLDSYDNAIKRVEMDVRDELELDDTQFSAWIQDDWNWQGLFVANTTRYSLGN